MMARAVIYCRCSTEEETQKNALLQQVGEARESILQKGEKPLPQALYIRKSSAEENLAKEQGK